MTEAEYAAATAHREAESVRVLTKVMPEDLAVERVRRGTARFLPDGLHTVSHYLLTAENEAGEVVGNTWIGPDPNNASAAWVYDLDVFTPFRRRGYGTAILAAAEVFAAEEGRTALGLSVDGDNEAAIALYRRRGFAVTSMSMRKKIPAES